MKPEREIWNHTPDCEGYESGFGLEQGTEYIGCTCNGYPVPPTAVAFGLFPEDFGGVK